MAKASLTLPDGTKILIEGNPNEIQKIISLYSPVIPPQGEKKLPEKQDSQEKKHDEKSTEQSNLAKIVNTAKTSQEIELIEKNVLDRSSLVDRILLPLYITQNYGFEDKVLTSGDIAKFLSQFGVSIAQPNIAKTLASTAKKYVIGDKIRKKGHAVGYRLSRRGKKYITAVIHGKPNE